MRTTPETPTPAPLPLPRRGFAEFVGTGLLVAVVVGSGIAAQRLAPGELGLQLLANSLATVFGLGVLILLFAPVSGAHFNPVVSAADWLLGRPAGTGLTSADLALYVVAQTAGGVAGAALANVMFDLVPLHTAATARGGVGIWTGEIVATAGLVGIIFALARSGRGAMSAAAVIPGVSGGGGRCAELRVTGLEGTVLVGRIVGLVRLDRARDAAGVQHAEHSHQMRQPGIVAGRRPLWIRDDGEHPLHPWQLVLQVSSLHGVDEAFLELRTVECVQRRDVVLVEREEAAAFPQVDQFDSIGVTEGAVWAAVDQRDRGAEQVGAQPAERAQRPLVARHICQEPGYRPRRTETLDVWTASAAAGSPTAASGCLPALEPQAFLSRRPFAAPPVVGNFWYG